MPSLRKRVSTYLRQLSFHNEPRDKRNNVNENAFITKYLQGNIALREGPAINYGKIPTDLPNYELGKYERGANSIVGCYSGPNGGLTTVRRTEKHLSVPDDDIDFIDNPETELVPPSVPKKSPKRVSGQPIDNTTMVIKVAGNEYCVTNKPKRHSKSYSLGSISDFNIEVETTKIDKEFYNCDNKPTQIELIECTETPIVECAEGTSNGHGTNSSNEPKHSSNKPKKHSSKEHRHSSKQPSLESSDNKNKVRKHNLTKTRVTKQPSSDTTRGGGATAETKPEPHKGKSYILAKSRSEGNPFQHKKRGKVVQVQRQPRQKDGESSENVDPNGQAGDSVLPVDWNRKSDCCYGISDSLYDRNQVTRQKNGDPIADCFGIIARNDSAILALADGVNWGEKASVAAKSAVHGSLHYLNKTIFNDTKLFESLTTKSDEVALSGDSSAEGDIASMVTNTREVFVCLLRAFNCAHDLILENKGMLTTLTVAVVLPLKTPATLNCDESQYVCCVCNVGDTLAYVYSQKTGIRELTKGSHDVHANRDMRDALGALGPVDGINPELSNLTLSVTVLSKGDIVLVASDGLTDNFDPNVCRFTVNSASAGGKSDSAKGVKRNPNKVRSHSPAEPKKSHDQKKNPAKVRTHSPAEPKKSHDQRPPVKPPRKSKSRPGESLAEKVVKQHATSKETPASCSRDPELNPLKEHFMRENSLEESTTPPPQQNRSGTVAGSQAAHAFRLMKAKTSVELRPHLLTQTKMPILRNKDGVPYASPLQRYELQLLLMEDILRKGISGRDKPIATARRLCESLVSFTVSITSAKRHSLEDADLYFDNRHGVAVEASNHEKKVRRKRAMDKVQSLPGKLDHVSVVAYNVGNVAL